MKKVLAITLMLLLLATAATCAIENNWRVNMKADNGAGGSPAPGAALGIYPTSIDGLDTQDGAVYGGIGADTPGTATHVVAAVSGQAGLYGKSLKSLATEGEKTWDFYAAGNVNYAASVIRLRLFTFGATSLPTAVVAGQNVQYSVRLLAVPAGVAGAPAVGTVWQIPVVPTVHSATVPYWESPLLPAAKLLVKANDDMFTNAYKFQFVQTIVPNAPVPEPSSMLALGTGLIGLVGFVTRRRRA